MANTTRERLVEAAAALLDRGGEAAVTLRAVADAVRMSHNAPYRHFGDRAAILAGVAERDLRALEAAFSAILAKPAPAESLKGIAATLIAFADRHPARYRLLFSDPSLASSDGCLEAAGWAAFQVLVAVVEREREEGGVSSTVDPTRLAGLIYATLHGAIDLALGGRAKESKGLGDVEATAGLLFGLLR